MSSPARAGRTSIFTRGQREADLETMKEAKETLFQAQECLWYFERK